jgi:Zn-dependent protease with chaperone function
MKTTAYRYPNEHLVLALTLLVVLAVIALTAAATVCASGLFVLAFIVVSFYMGRAQHQELVRVAEAVTPQSQPDLDQLVRQGAGRLQPGPVDVFVASSEQLNAYTFGLTSPKAVVMYSGLFRVMDEDELLFILGHEMGHVALGHTWLNSLVGGMAGIPASWSVGAILTVVFLWWNRMCEYSADRAGMLACGKPDKAISALVKLGAGPNARTRGDLEQAYQRIDAEDDGAVGALSEVLATHPLLIRRIENLRRYARSEAYQTLQSRIIASN